MSVPFRVLGDRVVIKADREDHAPQQTESGIVLAKTLAAAVDGSDAEDSWFVGTIVAVGPLVNRFDCREWTKMALRRITDSKYPNDIAEAMWLDFCQLPTDCADPLHVGDRVTFSWAAGQQIKVDDEKFLIMRQRDVLAVLEPDESELSDEY